MDIGNFDKIKTAEKIVNEQIEKTRRQFEEILKCEDQDQDQILVEGYTTGGYSCHVLVDAKVVARIYLRHNMHIFRHLNYDIPEQIWEDLAEEIGLAEVGSADL